jgi:hypothetical protein
MRRFNGTRAGTVPPDRRPARRSLAKPLQCQHFTSEAKRFHGNGRLGKRGVANIESTFGNWRSAVVGIGLTVAVVGGALAAAFL